MIELRANRYQQRFYLEWALDRGSRMYNTPLVYEIEGELDEAALTTALDDFVNRCHPGCRSHFVERDGVLLQCLAPHVELGLRDINGASGETIDALLERELDHAFDLERGPLFRFAMLRAQARRVLVLNFHHIISDATSAIGLVELLKGAYQHFTVGGPLPPKPPVVLEEEADPVRRGEDLAYWCELLRGRSLHVDLPRQVRGEVAGADGESHFFDLDAGLTERLRGFCKTQRCTPFMVIAAACGVVLGRHAATRALVLNYPVDSRPGTARNAQGCFVNNVPLPLDVSPGRSLIDLVEEIRGLRKAARQHAEFSLTEVVRQLRESAMAEQNLFNVSVIEAYFDDTPVTLGTGLLRPLPLARRQVAADLSVAYQPAQERIRFRIDYRLDAFAASFISRLAESLRHALSVMLDAPARGIDAGTVLPPAMRESLHAMAQGEPAGAIGQEGVMAMLLRTAAAHPASPALLYRGHAVSYRETLRAAARVAAHLARDSGTTGAGEGAELVGVYCARKDLAVLCMLGVLGAGRAYVPIDPKMPAVRLREICAESGMAVLLTDLPAVEGLAGPRVLAVGDELLAEAGAESAGIAQPMTPSPQALAYVIYTSGSTGKPKGVRIEHGKLGNAVADFVAALGVSAEDRVVGTTAIGFDIFGLELFMALATGASLLLLDREMADPGVLRASLDLYRPTVMQGTPSFWSLLAMADWRPAESSRLIALCGGEALSRTLAAYLLRVASAVHQVYGPTETTIWSSRQRMRDETDYAVIGRPIGATRCHVLDANGELLPWGACGELYIGGAGVSSGYHRREDLSAERFPELLLDGTRLERLYRTGDRVCWNERGELIYLGRLDFQVKVRGHRVELGEVELGLNRLAGVKQAAACAVGVPGQLELAAWLVLEAGVSADLDGWRAALRQTLPEYMIPRSFQVLEALPQTINGKIDRKALPAPAMAATGMAIDPDSDAERVLLGIWRSVLGNPSIGVTDHFMAVGGHSLLAAQMLIAAGRAFSVELSFADLLAAPTVRELCEKIAAASPAAVSAAQTRAMRFQLSLEQRHLHFIDRYEGGTGHTFNLSVVQQIDGPLDVGALSRALQALLPRHDMLNVRLVDEGAKPAQQLAPQPVPALAARSIAPSALDAALREAVSAPFDLACPPLYRLTLLRCAPQRHLLVLVVPHIVADGWSLEILSRELTVLYRAELAGTPAQLPAPRQFYSDAVERQARWLASPSYQASLEFWRERLAGYAGLDLPADFPATRERDFRGAHHSFEVGTDLTAGLKALSSRLAVSLFDCLYTVFALQLRRYCRQRDLVISVPSANRRAGNEEVVGLFTSMLPLRIAIDDDLPFDAQVSRLSTHSRAALAHQGVPLEALRGGADSREAPSHSLLQAVFALQNANQQHTLQLDGVACRYVEVEDRVARYELFLDMREEEGRLIGRIEYPESRFTRGRIERMGQHFVQLAEQAAHAPAMPVGDYQIVTPAEVRHLSDLAPALPAGGEPGGMPSLVDCYARSAAACPSAIALENDETQLSYAELDELSERLAKRLRSTYRREHGAPMPAETLVGLCLERGPSVVVAMLAILKAGGAYLPLDPSYPQARLRYMARDSGIGLIVSTRAELARSGLDTLLAPGGCLLLDAPEPEPAHSDEVLPRVTGDQLAYVIYTSGSTGNPKGALLTHSNVTRLFESSAGLFDFSERDCWCLFHSYAFDFSVWEIWGALRHGARLLTVSSEISRDPEQFRALLQRHGVSVLNQTPGAFVRLIEEDARHAERLALRYVIFGGEALQVATLGPWFARYGEATRLVNMYGITETAVHVSFKPVSAASLDRPGCNDIGRPLPDLRVLVLDDRRRWCPLGVAGEMYVAGPGLARGYLNQPELSARAFVSDPALLDGARLYKTGDLARWLENGNLEYLGRNDHQVKIRGFRVELGEVQAALMRMPQVVNAVAVHDRERDGIAVYYAAAEPLDPEAARARLRADLPEFMLPQRLVHVGSLPLTANGKIDLAALRQLEAQMPVLPAAPRVAPQGDAQRLLARVWEQVLGQPGLGANTDFFAAGGDSLRVLDVIRLVREAGFVFSPRDLFRNPTIAQLAEVLTPAGEGPAQQAHEPFALLAPVHTAACREHDDEDIYPLTALQEGMVFHSSLQDGSSTYLDLMTCRVQGPFDLQAFVAVLTRLVGQQPVLRTRFLRNAAGAWQKVKHTVPLPLRVCRVESSTAEDVEAELAAFFAAELAQGFDTDVAPLWRITVHRLEAAFHLSLCCHHAILDGWSVATMLTGLLRDYDASLGGTRPASAPPGPVFRDYVAQEMRQRRDRAALDFWLAHWQGRESTLLAEPMPGAAGELNRHRLPIDADLHQAVRAAATAHSVPIDTVLLGAHLLALSRSTGQRGVSTGIASHGRLAEDAGHRMLGLFLNTVTCSLPAEPAPSPVGMLRQLLEFRAELQPYAGCPLGELQREVRRGPLFDTLFNYVNFHVFGELGALAHLSVTQGYCYEETNFALVNQTSIDPLSGALQVELVHRTDRLATEKVERFGLLFLDALCWLCGIETSAREAAALASAFPARDWFGGGGTPVTGSLAERARAAARRWPDAIALRAGERSLDYRGLDRWAETLAASMLARHGGTLGGARVGLLASREPATIAAMLAIVKLGAAYVPLDPGYPQAHLESLLADAAPALVVGSEAALAGQRWLGSLAMALPDWPQPFGTVEPQPLPSPAGLAYVMYTSGSTGRPKGVMVEQAGILRLVLEAGYIAFQPGEIVAQAASLSFDAATLEVWGALLNGATLALVPPDTLLDGARFEYWLLDQRVDTLFLTTRLFDRFVATGHAAMFRRLRYLVIGGDAMDPATVSAVWHCPAGRPRHICNGYGPTENTTFTTVHQLSEASLTAARVPIGRPIAHTQVYVLDEAMRQVPIGVTGELYTAGAGLARGYLGEDARTAAAFVELALPDADDATPRLRRLYRTGDAARWLPNGELDCLGRRDRMVKISGFRVDLGEVEAAARACDAVEQCIAVLMPGERRQVVLYFSGSLAAPALRAWLAERVPAFMLPARLVEVAAFVLNRNGKIDTSRLPPVADAGPDQDYEPADPASAALLEIWRSLLGPGQIGPHDNFFERGGDSLLAMQLQHHIDQAFRIELPIVDVFRYPTIEAMAARLGAPQPSPAARGEDHAAARRAAGLAAQRARLQRQSGKEQTK
ncbi:amino acid adenylation domain-containing protein (plasmid) [Burkholderia glumae]|uniref:non-ribosomal peptide synthetase n=1 Tax=Burkholderia glumae TaxID=337 RepID=UPI002150A8A9|nr:non-ribosomal peptide synthetase [Burkholderia glumae]UVS82803.1 amino acid adenylation domain-containing protein [Burkholderia glumae]UVT00248.1 amino acid adenylation domain-containing protein [Burkholderia glumae]